MTTSTLTAEQRRNVHFVGSDLTGCFEGAPKPTFEFKQNEQGATILHAGSVPVFRSGTFRDSMGMQHTWEEIHLDQMTQHFDLLRTRHLFEDVPVRDGHKGWIISDMPGNGQVIGYHTALRVEKHTSNHDGKEYSYLVADYEIIDEDAQKKIQSGLWRNRSAEIGPYVTNDETEFWPVYRGVAYVDIPAVEGLQSFSSAKLSVVSEKEFTVTSSTAQPGAGSPPVPPVVPIPGQQHSAPTPTVFAFKCNGGEVSDFAKVQAHIDGLELFRKETIEQGRKDFVTQLATDKKILASQVDSLTTVALSLNDEQWQSWKSAYDAAPTSQLLTQQGTATGQEESNNSSAQKKSDTQEVETLTEIVRNHKRAGRSVEAIQATESYKRLVELDSTFKL